MDHDTDDTSTAVPPDNDEATAIPNTAATEAADAEHTEAADIADSETQSIHAWSHADDDTETIQRRSWKIPVTLASLAAAAAVTTGVVMFWPQHHIVAAQTPTASQPAPTLLPTAAPPTVDPIPLTPDQQYLAGLNRNGLSPLGDPAVAIKAAHGTCDYLEEGHTRTDAVQHYTVNNPDLTPTQLATIIELSTQAYCPGN